jgi:hypothetical protein
MTVLCISMCALCNSVIPRGDLLILCLSSFSPRNSLSSLYCNSSFSSTTISPYNFVPVPPLNTGTAGGKAGQGGVRVSNNLYYNSEGDIVYPAAALGVKRSHKDAGKPEVIGHGESFIV